MSDKPWGMAVGPDLNDNEQPRIVAGGELVATEVIRPGSQVSIADGKITATVTAVALYAHGGTLYEVAWWHEGQRMSEWIAEGEIGAEQEKINVGFR